MTEAEQLKILCLTQAAKDIERLLNIIGDLGYVGYKISLCKIKGYSHKQCARKFGISKSLAQWHWDNCRKKGYHIHLEKMFASKNA
jgi:hypothetical protein